MVFPLTYSGNDFAPRVTTDTRVLPPPSDWDWHPTAAELKAYCTVWRNDPLSVDDDTFLKYEGHMLGCDDCVALAKAFERSMADDESQSFH